jgi:glutathione S-transferase
LSSRADNGGIAMAQLTLYHGAPSRSSIVHWMLEEVGQPYELKLLDLKKGENRQPGYLAINPMGKVPALKHGDVVITEAAAICCYLADAFPAAGLAVPIGDARRGPYLKWLFFGPSCLEPALIDKMLKREGASKSTVGWGDYDTVLDVLTRAVTPGPYLLGDLFTAADVVIGSGLRWGMMFKGIPETPEFARYTTRLAQRPALKRAIEKDGQLMAAAQAGAASG